MTNLCGRFIALELSVYHFRSLHKSNLPSTSHSYTLDGSRQGIVIMDANLVAKKYLETWFVFDVISSLPISSVCWALQFNAPGNVLLIFKVLKLSRVMRLIKLFKLNTVGTKLDDVYVDLMVCVFVRVFMHSLFHFLFFEVV